MLLESAIGDAYGVGFEYADENIKYNDLSKYVQHPTHSLKPGRYSDDTQMSIAVAEAIVEDMPWTKQAIADKFVAIFVRDPRDGYSRAFQKILNVCNSGSDLIAMVKPDSQKSGGAMRSGPLGYIKDIHKLIEMASVQASVTHDTELGRAAAIAASLMNHYFIYKIGSIDALPEFLCKYVPCVDWTNSWSGRVLSLGVDSVRAALWAVINNKSLSGTLKTCIDYTGDTDTVASIAMSAASCCDSIINDIPDALYWGLERTKYGTEYIERLDVKLKSKFQ